jgi:hypothetical protein
MTEAPMTEAILDSTVDSMAAPKTNAKTRAGDPGSHALGVRAKWPALMAGLVAGLAAVALGSVTWYRNGSVTMTGRVVTDALVPVLGYTSLALVGLILTLRRRGRIVAAVLLFALGLGQTATAVWRHVPSAAAIAQSGATGTGSVTIAWWGLVVAGVVTVISAAAIAVSSPSWPDKASRYERGRSTTALSTPLEVWKAMDAGIDPTAESVSDETPGLDEPDSVELDGPEDEERDNLTTDTVPTETASAHSRPGPTGSSDERD